MLAIELEDVCKTYKNGVKALDGLSLKVRKGEIFSLLGPNGAGKSTLIRLLTTYSKADRGKVEILGKNLEREAGSIRPLIACVSQNISVDTHLSLLENMKFQAGLYKVPALQRERRTQQLIEGFGLERYLEFPVAGYSGGIKRRLDIAMNLISNPHILFLDEPTTGMDIQSRMAMWSMMKTIRDTFETTILLTTHYLEEAQELSDAICIMNHGKNLLQGTAEELRRHLGYEWLEVGFVSTERAEQGMKILQRENVLHELGQKGKTVYCKVSQGELLLGKVQEVLAKFEIPFVKLEVSPPTLDDVFIQLTGEEKKGMI